LKPSELIFSNISKKVTNFFQPNSPSSNMREEKLKLIDIRLQETQYNSAKKIANDILPKCRPMKLMVFWMCLSRLMIMWRSRKMGLKAFIR